MLEKPKFLDKVKVNAFAYNANTPVVVEGQRQAGGRKVSTFKNRHPETIYTVIGTVNLPQGYSEYIGYEEGYGFKHTGNVQVFIVANTIGVRYKVRLEDMELAGTEAEEIVVALPCKVGDIAHVDIRTFPQYYLHPFDNCRGLAKCEVIGFSITKSGTFIKMAALYPSRMNKRGYLRYGVGAIGKTVFLRDKP